MSLAAAVAAARAALSGAGLRPAVAAHDAWIASGLESVLPETALFCLQRSTAIDVMRARGVEVFCLSEHTDRDRVAGTSTVDLMAHPAAQAFCRQNGPFGVLAFKPTERLATLVAAAGGRLLSGNPAAARAAENKLEFVALARAAGLPTPDWEILTLAAGTDFGALAQRWGGPFVVQGARGNAGRRTHVVRDQADLEQVLRAEAGRPLRVAQLVEGLPATATGLVSGGAEGPLVSWIEPCRQVTGLPWLTALELGSCGNVWDDGTVAPASEAMRAAGESMAAALAGRGYAGAFGIDFVVAESGPVVIETNPRMVASLPLATQAEAESGRVPLLLRALLVHLGATIDPDRSPPPSPLGPLAQLIVHRLDSDVPGRRLTESGVYRVAAGSEPARLRDGAVLADVAAEDEALVLTREEGEPISPEREFARIYLRNRAGETTPGVRELVAALRGTP